MRIRFVSFSAPVVATVAFAALTLFAAPAARAQQFTYGPGPGGPIPDANAVGVTSVIPVLDTFTIASFDSITITGFNHAWVGDLVVTLSHGGVSVDILDRLRGNGVGGAGSAGDNSNLGGDYTFLLGGADINAAAAALDTTGVIPPGAYAPHTGEGGTGITPGGSSPNTQTLADFAGQSVFGPWTLNISDRFVTDVGSFTGWSFTVTTAPAQTAIPEPGTLALLTAVLPLGAAVLRRRRRF